MIILRNKTYSHEEEIANIAAAPGSPEYSHERAEIEKKPTQEASAVQEGYEKASQEIDKTVEEIEIVPEAREAGDSNLDSRNDALKTLNDFLGNIH